MPGPELEFSDQLHAEKYRARGESFREAMQRVANALKDGDDHYRETRDILMDMRFMPAGRIQAAMGSTKRVTPYNCFVSGTIEDSFVDGHGCIMKRATEAARTMRMGGGIGYDFSTLRPRGAQIKKLGSRSSGPVSFMSIYDAVCRCIASSGHRRGAQMGVMRVDHPDIEEFIHAKQNKERLKGFNVSIAVTNRFMECLIGGEPFPLEFRGEVYKEVDPQALWEMIMRSTWDWADPGVLFIDTINKQNNLWYCEEIAATNPCGEQPLPPYGACLLGSFNLVKYVKVDPAGKRFFDHVALANDVPAIVRMLDNVVDRAIYPLHEQENEALGKRRMGLGVTGMANALEACGFPYGSIEFQGAEQLVLESLRDAAYAASIDLAKEKGSFPMFKASDYILGPFIRRLPDYLKEEIARTGIRNSHLTSIAPTGTISLCADNISSGIEPVFEYVTRRTVQMDAGPRQELVEDYGRRVFNYGGKVASEVTAQEHLGVLKAAVPYVDSAISKTCNVPSTMGWDEFKDIYLQAWEAGAKGCTTYQVGGKRDGILEPVMDEEPGGACYIDTATGRRECE